MHCRPVTPTHRPAAPPTQVKRLEKELAEAERKVVEGEALRRRLHNQLQELKVGGWAGARAGGTCCWRPDACGLMGPDGRGPDGRTGPGHTTSARSHARHPTSRPLPTLQGNIRVFARVRPAAEGEAGEAAPGRPVVAFPTAGDLAGRGLELVQPAGGGAKGGGEAQAHSFGFDRVFAPTASQVGAAAGRLRCARGLRRPAWSEPGVPPAACAPCLRSLPGGAPSSGLHARV